MNKAVVCAVIAIMVLLPATTRAAEGLSLSCEAQSEAELPLEEGRQLMARVQKVYEKVRTLKATFMQRSYSAALDVEEVSHGRTWFHKPGRMKWSYEVPEEQILIVKDSTVWLYQALEAQVMIDTFSDILITDMPVAFFMGLGDLQRDFSLLRACTHENGVVLALESTTSEEEGGGQLAEFLLLVRTSDAAPIGAQVVDIGGNQNTIWLREVVLNATIAQDTFKPDFPSGIDVIDRR